jgi:hypothetical protein
MTIKTFRRASAAYAAAGNDPVLVIHEGRENVYLTGIQRLTEIAIIAKRPSDARQYTGFIGCGHLDRLGNANGAIRTDRQGSGEIRAFEQAGLMQRDAAPIVAAIDQAIGFIAGFDGDELQEGIPELLDQLRGARQILKN